MNADGLGTWALDRVALASSEWYPHPLNAPINDIRGITVVSPEGDVAVRVTYEPCEVPVPKEDI